MGKTRGPYKEEFPVGSTVKIVARGALDTFLRDWKFHNPLNPEQLASAGREARVKSVSFYHGGDELYSLDGIPGIWHEENLMSTE